MYGNCPKILKRFNLYNFYNFYPYIFIFIPLFYKILGGMANSADPDQTALEGAVWSRAALFVYAILSEKLV